MRENEKVTTASILDSYSKLLSLMENFNEQIDKITN